MKTNQTQITSPAFNPPYLNAFEAYKRADQICLAASGLVDLPKRLPPLTELIVLFQETIRRRKEGYYGSPTSGDYLDNQDKIQTLQTHLSDLQELMLPLPSVSPPQPSTNPPSSNSPQTSQPPHFQPKITADALPPNPHSAIPNPQSKPPFPSVNSVPSVPSVSPPQPSTNPPSPSSPKTSQPPHFQPKITADALPPNPHSAIPNPQSKPPFPSVNSVLSVSSVSPPSPPANPPSPNSPKTSQPPHFQPPITADAPPLCAPTPSVSSVSSCKIPPPVPPSPNPHSAIPNPKSTCGRLAHLPPQTQEEIYQLLYTQQYKAVAAHLAKPVAEGGYDLHVSIDALGRFYRSQELRHRREDLMDLAAATKDFAQTAGPNTDLTHVINHLIQLQFLEVISHPATSPERICRLHQTLHRIRLADLSERRVALAEAKQAQTAHTSKTKHAPGRTARVPGRTRRAATGSDAQSVAPQPPVAPEHPTDPNARKKNPSELPIQSEPTIQGRTGSSPVPLGASPSDPQSPTPTPPPPEPSNHPPQNTATVTDTDRTTPAPGSAGRAATSRDTHSVANLPLHTSAPNQAPPTLPHVNPNSPPENQQPPTATPPSCDT